MRHSKHKGKLNITVSHRKSLLANQVCSLIENNRIVTTLAKAKQTSRLADKMVTLGKKNTLHATRQIVSTIRSKTAAKRLVDEIAPLFKERNGGYTRIIRHKNRPGDGAQLAILEFTETPKGKELKEKVKKEKEVVETEGEAQKIERPHQHAQQKVSKKARFFGGLKNFIKNK